MCVCLFLCVCMGVWCACDRSHEAVSVSVCVWWKILQTSCNNWSYHNSNEKVSVCVRVHKCVGPNYPLHVMIKYYKPLTSNPVLLGGVCLIHTCTHTHTHIHILGDKSTQTHTHTRKFKCMYAHTHIQSAIVFNSVTLLGVLGFLSSDGLYHPAVECKINPVRAD